MINLYQIIADQIENQTQFPVESFDSIHQSIEPHKIFLRIQSIAKTSIKNSYKVAGELAVKHGCSQGFEVLSTLLDLELTGTRTEAKLSTQKSGFSVMSLGFCFYVNIKKQDPRLKEVEIVNIHSHHSEGK